MSQNLMSMQHASLRGVAETPQVTDGSYQKQGPSRNVQAVSSRMWLLAAQPDRSESDQQPVLRICL